MSPSPQWGQLPAGLVSLNDHERHAQTVLDASAWAYLSGGAADELTLQANRTQWQNWHLLPRVLRPLTGSHTQVDMLGRRWAHPILVAPVAYQRLAHPDGEWATAMAAAAQRAGMVLSTQSSVSLASVAQAVLSEAERGPLWFQLYVQAQERLTLDLVHRAEQAGYEALVVTVDAPAGGVRDRERRAGFTLPANISAVNVSNTFCPSAPTWADLARLQRHTTLPILLKGIMHPADARQAVAMGFAGVIVSNHGGRTLDSAPGTLTMLPHIAQAVAGRALVMVDGGIRRGTDVLKALALGAQAVMVGRPIVYGLANAGAVGVAHVLRLLQDELTIAMAQCGCATLADVGPSLVMPSTALTAPFDGDNQ